MASERRLARDPEEERGLTRRLTGEDPARFDQVDARACMFGEGDLDQRTNRGWLKETPDFISLIQPIQPTQPFSIVMGANIGLRGRSLYAGR
jgi:hypothetical protein